MPRHPPTKKPPVVIAVINDKGGVGKTTLSVMLAQFLSQRGKRVLLRDNDTSGSACAWQRNADLQLRPLPFDVAPNAQADAMIEAGEYQYVIVDTPADAKARHNIPALAASCDHLLLLLQPGPLEIDRMNVTMQTIRSSNMREGLRIGLILNSLQHSRVSRNTLDYLKSQNLPVIGTVPRRAAYQSAFGKPMDDALLAPAESIIKAITARPRSHA